MKQQKTSTSGFTIIEVVLVLAIAGLIFLMVFIALPALQRSQRDTQRKDDVGKFLSQINSYQSNNRGSVPPSDTTSAADPFVSQYLRADGDQFADPSGDDYTVTAHTGTAPDASSITSDDLGTIYYNTRVVCGGGGNLTASTSRKVAVRTYLEGGGIYCSNN